MVRWSQAWCRHLRWLFLPVLSGPGRFDVEIKYARHDTEPGRVDVEMKYASTQGKGRTATEATECRAASCPNRTMEQVGASVFVLRIVSKTCARYLLAQFVLVLPLVLLGYRVHNERQYY